MRIFELQEATGPTLWVDRENHEPLLVLHQVKPPAEAWRLPSMAVELTTRDEVIEEILGALEKLPKLSKTARTVVEGMLEALPR